MIVTTGNEVEMGKITQYLGVVRGNCGAGNRNRARNHRRILKPLGGGNISKSGRTSAKPHGKKHLTECSPTRKRSAQMPLSVFATTQPNFRKAQQRFWLTGRRLS